MNQSYLSFALWPCFQGQFFLLLSSLSLPPTIFNSSFALFLLDFWFNKHQIEIKMYFTFIFIAFPLFYLKMYGWRIALVYKGFFLDKDSIIVVWL